MGQESNAGGLPLGENRREHKRHGVLIKVRLKDQEKLRGLYATDLSLGGLFVATKTAFPVGQKLAVKLVHPLNGSSFAIGCEVVNVRRDEDGTVRGCGLKFRSFDDDLRERLYMFVEGVLEPEPEDEAEEPPGTSEAAELVEGPPPEATPQQLQAHSLLLRALKTAHDGDLVGAAHLLARATALDPTQDALWEALRDVEDRLAEEAIARAEEAQRNALPIGEPSPPPPAPAPEERLSDVDDLTDELEDLVEDDEEDDWEEPDVDWEEPVVVLEEPAELEPADRRKAKLLFDAAQDCYETQDWDDAIHYLKKAIGTDPAFAPAYGILANIMASQKDDVERALFLCKKAIELEPRNERWQATLASLEGE